MFWKKTYFSVLFGCLTVSCFKTSNLEMYHVVLLSTGANTDSEVAQEQDQSLMMLHPFQKIVSLFDCL